MEEVTSKGNREHNKNDSCNEIPSKEIPPNPDKIFMALADTGTTTRQKGMTIGTIQNYMEAPYQIFKNVSEKPDR